jgi:3-hydroxymyristoyl/3-hydroxydecanoyl-(acyl carrier protein) dehydratase
MKEFVSEFSGPCRYRVEDQFFLHAEFYIDENHPHVDGHFESWQVLPGMTQLGIVLHLIGDHLGKKLALQRVKRAKFSGMIRPPATVQLQVVLGASFGSAKWHMKDDKQVYSTGTLEYV